jgi:hypothetical protein
MKKVLITMVAVLALAGTMFAADITKTANVTVSATVGSAASLALNQTTQTFADSDPATVPSIAATEGAITITAKARTGSSSGVTLTVVSGDDLKSGSDTILINNLTWTASGNHYGAGTMNASTAQTVASWTGSTPNPGGYVGAQTYALANSWAYATGSYTATLTYTLTVP